MPWRHETRYRPEARVSAVIWQLKRKTDLGTVFDVAGSNLIGR